MSIYDESHDPAFPVNNIDFEESANQNRTVYDEQFQGITIRDYFAAKAITGFTSATNSEGEWTTIGCANDIAEMAYQIADAMLKQREL